MSDFVTVLPPDSDIPQRVHISTFKGVYEARGFTLVDSDEPKIADADPAAPTENTSEANGRRRGTKQTTKSTEED